MPCSGPPTNYFFNKRTSLIAVARTWPIGVGPGRQPALAGTLRREDFYPANLRLGTPHSSYLGAAAEAGLPGVLGLAGLLGGSPPWSPRGRSANEGGRHQAFDVRPLPPSPILHSWKACASERTII
jgi:hypothetical protein